MENDKAPEAKDTNDSEYMGVKLPNSPKPDIDEDQKLAYIGEDVPPLPSKPKHSVLTHENEVFDVSRAFDSDVEEGIVVTDKKRRHPSILQTLENAMNEWWQSRSGGVKKIIKYIKIKPREKSESITHPSSTPKKVVQRAVTQSMQKTDASHDLVVEKLKDEYGEVPHKEPEPIARPKFEEPEEDREPLVIHNQPIAAIHRHEHVPAKPKKQQIKFEHEQETTPVLEKKQPVIPKRHKGRFWHHLGTNALNILFIVVIVNAIVAGIALGIYIFSRDTLTHITEITGNRNAPSSFLIGANQAPIPLTGSRNEFLSSLDRAIAGTNGRINHIYPVKTLGEDESVPATTEEVFALIDPRVPDTFIRSLELEMMFGGIEMETKKRYLILKSRTFDTSFAGMLAWEPYIVSDFSPLFGNAEEGRFTDQVVENRSIRVLRNSDGETVLVYSFINRNTIIITTSINTLEALVSALK